METQIFEVHYDFNKSSYYAGFQRGRKFGFHAGLTWGVLASLGCLAGSIVLLWLLSPQYFAWFYGK